MEQATATTFGLHISDVTGQRTFRATSVPTHSTVGELVQGLLAKLGLASTDAQGVPLAYRARLNREARHLHGSELVGDALVNDDRITLQPSIDAG